MIPYIKLTSRITSTYLTTHSLLAPQLTLAQDIADPRIGRTRLGVVIQGLDFRVNTMGEILEQLWRGLGRWAASACILLRTVP